jgi:DNA-binding MarR family transcriptional regulator
MKRSTDEIRYFILKSLIEGRCNLEAIRAKLETGLQTVSKNAESLEAMRFIKIYETKFGKRKYRELEITSDGKMFFERIKKLFE